MRRRRHSGFTTIELAFVLAIVSLLAAIAVIELNTQVMLARRTEGLIGLNALWKAQQLHLVEHGRYAASFAELDFAIEGGSLVPLTPNMYRGRCTPTSSRSPGEWARTTASPRRSSTATRGPTCSR